MADDGYKPGKNHVIKIKLPLSCAPVPAPASCAKGLYLREV